MAGGRKSSARGVENYVALFRGVNVGGKNRLPMAALAEMFSAAGCARVQTYIQCGNVAFAAERACAEALPGVIAGKVAARFGFSPVIVLRTGEELAAAVRGNPFSAADVEAGWVHIGFLQTRPEAKAVAALDPQRSPGDFFVVRGGEIYLKLAGGMGKTKLTNAWFDARLKTTSTFRNWRTLLKLVELTRDP